MDIKLNAEQAEALDAIRAFIPQPLQQLLASDWYKRIELAGTFGDLPRADVDARKLLRELGRQELTYTRAVIDNVNSAKALSHAATGANSGFVLLYSRFPEVTAIPIGTVIEVGHVEADRQARDWRSCNVETVPGFFEVVSGTLERFGDQPFAFIRSAQRDVFVPPHLGKRFTAGRAYEVTCYAIWSTNKEGKTGWRALKFTEEIETSQVADH